MLLTREQFAAAPDSAPGVLQARSQVGEGNDPYDLYRLRYGERIINGVTYRLDDGGWNGGFPNFGQASDLFARESAFFNSKIVREGGEIWVPDDALNYVASTYSAQIGNTPSFLDKFIPVAIKAAGFALVGAGAAGALDAFAVAEAVAPVTLETVGVSPMFEELAYDQFTLEGIGPTTLELPDLPEIPDWLRDVPVGDVPIDPQAVTDPAQFTPARFTPSVPSPFSSTLRDAFTPTNVLNAAKTGASLLSAATAGQSATARLLAARAAGSPAPLLLPIPVGYSTAGGVAAGYTQAPAAAAGGNDLLLLAGLGLGLFVVLR